MSSTRSLSRKRLQGDDDDLSCSLFRRYNGTWAWIMGNLAIASHSENDKEGFSYRLDWKNRLTAGQRGRITWIEASISTSAIFRCARPAIPIGRGRGGTGKTCVPSVTVPSPYEAGSFE